MSLVNVRPARPIPIRITPLIDVVFILLVFFMLTTRLLPTNDITLATTTGTVATETSAPLPKLVLQANGQLQWQQQVWSVDQLIRALATTGVNEVVLQTDRATALGDFTRSLSELEAAGIRTHWQKFTGDTTE